MTYFKRITSSIQGYDTDSVQKEKQKFIDKPKAGEKLETLTYLRKLLYSLVLDFVLKTYAIWV